MNTHILKNIIFILLIIESAFFSSCKNNQELYNSLEIALIQSGSNRGELEKVLNRYKLSPKDSLKYRATCFLIENMPYYNYYEGELLDNYLTYYKVLATKNGKERLVFEEVSDSIKKEFGEYSTDKLSFKHDLLEIDSAYLCHNIDWAFKVWKEQPWGKNISFGDFCEYVLPYRIGDEKLTDWREKIYTKYNPILDSLRSTDTEKEDPINAVYCLMNVIAKQEEVRFTSVTPAILPHVGPELAELKMGTCREFTDFAVYVCRALGIPIAIDFVSIRGNENVGHFWAAFWDKKGKLYYQDFPQEVMPADKKEMQIMPKVKVYRYTFSQNRVMEQKMNKLDAIVHPFFKKSHFIDVTRPYCRYFTSNMQIPENAVYPGKPKGKIAYLCISQRAKWTPVAWTVFDRNNLTFPNIQKGATMCVATYEENKLIYWTDPFEISNDNKLHFITATDSIENMTLFAKYNPGMEDEQLMRDRMIGGVFEGSNDARFIRKDTLYRINESPGRLYTKVPAKQKKEYRYVRYYGPKDAHCNIAEAAFYNTDRKLLEGKVIGTPGCFEGDGLHEYSNVFDGKTTTSFDYKEGYGGWAGLDLGKPMQISEIVYTPRNRDNYICADNQYELFYFQKGWHSLGIQMPDTDSLLYKRAPKGALFILVNYSGGAQERIFTYEKGKQVWK